MEKKASMILSALLLLAVSLTGCTDKAPEGTDTPKKVEENKAATSEPKPGGIVKYGYTQPFKGVLDRAFYGGQDDDLILRFMMDDLLKTGDDLKTYPNIAEWTESDDHKTFTFKIKPGVKWHNGDELTMEDWKFALETIAHKDYTAAGGSRYSNVEMVVGVEDYREGKAKDIAGIKLIDNYTMSVTVKSAAPNTISNLWSYPMPKKYFAGVAVKDMLNSDQVRKKPIGIGPFKVKKIQPGEYVEMERFDDYWGGKPLLDGVIYKVVAGNMATSLLENGEIDIMEVPNSQFKDVEKLKNVNIDKQDALSYAYIGFKLGTWDKKSEKIVANPKSKFADKRLRQAMYYALDRQALIDAFANGLSKTISAPMPGVSWAKIPDDQLNPYEYNPDKAKKLLDEAGYKDTNGDGLREDPQGNKLTFNFDAMSGTEVAAPRAQTMMQMWKDVGLDVKLNGGALKEFNAFYDVVENDDPSVELFAGAWSLASDPDPKALWKSNVLWNFPRWNSAESDRLIDEGISEKAFDQNYRKEVYHKWQKLVNEEVPMMFLYSPIDVTVSNKRLQNVKANSFTNQIDVHKWWVTQ
ncbi:oligopeptide ABC transporter substrate-binding protein [Paenibacillus oleatilyticus]|uniref:oligopeptide ABC transporter substrate-binding protein n=1 Tax=Paenibacillus oleatilyticus TaxID=2594886 RepID=UPI001C1F3A31|nr:oligopeptide ABC transporter substrate-binding protein [Paenibacillus oleatilyticus]MBU7317755.1 oligopeptide ABC transporter substrate-binding protein [Paenibacillus oleatilyticus]